MEKVTIQMTVSKMAPEVGFRSTYRNVARNESLTVPSILYNFSIKCDDTEYEVTHNDKDRGGFRNILSAAHRLGSLKEWNKQQSQFETFSYARQRAL